MSDFEGLGVEEEVPGVTPEVMRLINSTVEEYKDTIGALSEISEKIDTFPYLPGSTEAGVLVDKLGKNVKHSDFVQVSKTMKLIEELVEQERNK